MTICKACGDAFDWSLQLELLRMRGIAPKKGEERYCAECAAELFRGIISTQPAKLYSAGRPGPEEQTEIEALDQALAVGKKTSNGHVLWTSATCPRRDSPDHEDIHCVVCDGGLAICSLCGEYEAGLDQPCPGKKEQPS